MSSGSGKKVAEKVLKDLDWERLGRCVFSEEGRKELNRLRQAFDDFNHNIRTKFSLKPEPIDWDYYRKRLPGGIVDLYQKSYESLKIPDYEDKVTPEFKKKWEGLMVKVHQQEEVSRKRIAECRENLKRLKEEEEALSTMTVDEYFAKHPELKARFDEEIRNHNWGYKKSQEG